MPGTRDRLPIYRLARPKVDDYLAQELARRTLNVDEFVTRETAGSRRIQVRSGSRVVEVHAGSGGVWAADEAQLWNVERKPRLPDREQAAKLAASLLADARLLPKLDDKSPVELAVDSIGGSFAAMEDGENRTRTQQQLDVQVNHAMRIRDVAAGATIPVVGGGGKLKVTLGDGGTPIGYSGTWRPIEGVAMEARVIPKPEADAAFEKRFARFEDLKYESYLAYYAAPARVTQEFLYPVYVYRASARIGKQIVPLRMITVPATTFGPPREIEPRQPRRSKKTRPGSALLVNPAVMKLDLPLARRGFLTVNPFECGTSWIGESGGLAGSKNNAKGFIDGLASDGWNVSFNWGDGNAWESDWRRNDDDWVDAADFVFYTGHANRDGWVLSNPDDTFLHTNEVGLTPSSTGDLWGRQDLEWMVIAACGPLQDDLIMGGGNVFDRWRGVFDGMHLFLGYAGITFDNEEEGESIVDYATDGTPLIDAWFRTAQEIQPSTNGAAAPDGPDVYVGAMYAYNSGTTSPRNDHLWDHGSVAPDPESPDVRVCMWTQT